MPPSVKNFLRIEFEGNLKIYVNNSLSFFLKVNQNLHILLFFVSWEKLEFELGFFFYLGKRRIGTGISKLCWWILLLFILYVYYLFYIILAGNNKPFRMTPSNFSESFICSVSGGQQTMLVL